MIYVTKIPVITGFQDKTCTYDVVLEYENHNLERSITDSLDMEELIEVIIQGDDGYIVNTFEFTKENMDYYSDAQFLSAVRIPYSNISLDDICPESAWNSFIAT